MTHLSLCIPTYNRADKLATLFNSIAVQAGHTLTIEVVVSDNASTDDTRAVVERFQRTGMPILYRQSDTNQGFDRNMLNVVAMASGEFCWLIGSDDFLEHGALARLQQGLEEHPAVDAASVGLRAYNADLSRTFFIDDGISTRFAAAAVLSGRDEIVARIGDRFGYISTTVVRRARWMEAASGPETQSHLNGYVHIYVLAKLLDEQSSWLCIPDQLVGYRTGNDSFQGRDEFARVRLDIDGYDRAFADTVGRDSRAYRRVMGRLANSYLRAHFVSAKLRGVGVDYWRQAIPLSVTHYWRYPGFWLRTLPVAAMPHVVVSGAQWVYRRTLKNITQRRGTTIS